MLTIIEEIKKIINDGILAPSGENCQPWRFEISSNVINVFNVPEADQSLYNFQQKGSYTAHGALITNLEISAREHGFVPTIEVFPDKNDTDLVSRITLTKAGSSVKEELYPFLSQRCTNRQDYDGSKLSSVEKNTLLAIAESSGAELRLLDDDGSLEQLGKYLAVNESVLFQNKKLHDFFYSHIIWKETEQEKAGGFYIKTLEFTDKQLKGVKLFRFWPILKLLNKVAGVAQMITKENSAKYAQSGTLGAIIVEGNASKDFVLAGRVAQKIWLTATKLGLAVHPCTGTLYLGERVKAGNGDSFSSTQRKEIKEACEGIRNLFQAGNSSIPMLFRIGQGASPTARSLRRPARIDISA